MMRCCRRQQQRAQGNARSPTCIFRDVPGAKGCHCERPSDKDHPLFLQLGEQQHVTQEICVEVHDVGSAANNTRQLPLKKEATVRSRQNDEPAVADILRDERWNIVDGRLVDHRLPVDKLLNFKEFCLVVTMPDHRIEARRKLLRDLYCLGNHGPARGSLCNVAEHGLEKERVSRHPLHGLDKQVSQLQPLARWVRFAPLQPRLKISSILETLQIDTPLLVVYTILKVRLKSIGKPFKSRCQRVQPNRLVRVSGSRRCARDPFRVPMCIRMQAMGVSRVCAFAEARHVVSPNIPSILSLLRRVREGAPPLGGQLLCGDNGGVRQGNGLKKGEKLATRLTYGPNVTKYGICIDVQQAILALYVPEGTKEN
eukprot:Opistho-2@739